MAGVTSLSAIGAVEDPRLEDESRIQSEYPKGVLEKLHDTSIPFEAYLHYAKISRDEEDRLYGPGSDYRATPGPTSKFFKEKVLRKHVDTRRASEARLSVSAQGEAQMTPSPDEKSGKNASFEPIPISDDEWLQASRAARTATW